MPLIEGRRRSGEFTRARARRGGPGDGQSEPSEEEAASKSILFVRGREGMTGHPFW